MLACYANEHAPGAYAATEIAYTSVAGCSLRGKPGGTFRERHAYDFYRRLGGDGESCGDGLVPVWSALLEGANQVTLDGVGHYKGYGSLWYGSPDVVPGWVGYLGAARTPKVSLR
jgi:hypothetical protein